MVVCVCVCVCVYLVWNAVQQVVQGAELPQDGLMGGRRRHGSQRGRPSSMAYPKQQQTIIELNIDEPISLYRVVCSEDGGDAHVVSVYSCDVDVNYAYIYI